MSNAKSLAAAFFLGIGTFAWTATVSVCFFEIGVPESAPPTEASSAWESGMLDALFEAGHIATNAVMERIELARLPSTSYGLAEARAGGAEYVIHVALEYGADGEPSARRSPRKALYRLSDARGTTLKAGETPALPPALSGDEDEGNARKIALILIDGIGRGK